MAASVPPPSHPKIALKVTPTRASATSSAACEDKGSMRQVRITVLCLVGVGILYALYLVFTGQFDEFVISLVGADLGWLIAGVLCFLCYYIFGVLAYVLAVITDPDSPVGIRDLMSVEAAGVFFMRLTPSGAGAPPAQIFRLCRAGLSVGSASALQFTRFVIYEAGEGIFAALMLLFCVDYFYQAFGDVTLLGVFLFGFKIVQVVGILALCLLPRPVMALGNKLLGFVSRRGWITSDKIQKYYDLINTQVIEFSSAFRGASKNLLEMSITLLVTLIQLGCMYALPYFVLRAFNQPADLLICLASGSMLELLINAVPLPGGTGGAEVGFAYLFKDMFGPHLAAGFVIWRAVEYLLPVLIAAPCMGMTSSRTGKSIYYRLQDIKEAFNRFVDGESPRPSHTKSASRDMVIKVPRTKK